MSDKIKLSELKDARATMTCSGPWAFDVPDDGFSGATVIRSTRCTCTGRRPSADHCPACNYVCDFAVLTEAPAIVAMHNAADALIELAEAALEYKCAWSSPANLGTEEFFVSKRRYEQALAKFEP